MRYTFLCANFKITENIMPFCELCSAHFPNKKFVDGKVRNLANRSYCLSCSPFGSRNSQRLTAPIPIDRSLERTCNTCSKLFTYVKSKGCTLNRCASCWVTYRRSVFKDKCVQYKGGKCLVCGYKSCNSVLEFHHLDRSQKSFSISGRTVHSWESTKRELDKCVLLCANHHREVECGFLNLSPYL